MVVELRSWKVLERKSLLNKTPWFHVWCETVQLPDGRIVEDYYKIEGLEGVVVVALTQDRQVITESHYKHGIGEITLDFPGGYIDSGETPIFAAKRELLEETGYKSKQWISLGRYVLDASRGFGAANIFLALNVLRNSEEISSNDLEDTHLNLMPFEQVLKAVFDGKVKEIAVAAAILLANQYLYGNLREDIY